MFTDDARTPGDVRHWVADLTGSLGPVSWTDDLMLMVSELVTNAVRHTSHNIGVTVYVHNCGIWVSVADDGFGRVELRHPVLTETSGRGLELVNALSSAWGVLSERSGKSVWFELLAANPSTVAA